MNDVPALTIAPLRRDLNITLQDHAGTGKVMVSHPLTGKVFLFPQRSFQILNSLQHGESLDDVLMRTTGSATPPHQARNAILTLLRQSRSAGLLEGDLLKGDQPVPRKSWSRWNPFFFRIPLGSPERLLNTLQPVARLLFSLPALALFLVGLAGAVVQLRSHALEYVTSFPVFGRFAAWPLFYLLWAASALLHELGHALACKRWNIKVRETGLLFYMFYPGAYADVSGAWTLPSVTRRVVISLAGLYMDTLLWIASVACWRWQGLESLAGQTAFIFSVVLVTRIAVNLIPFLRMDGYWVLSDLLRMPNLRSHSYGYLWSLVCPTRWNRFPNSRKIRTEATARQACVFVLYGLLALGFSAVMASYGVLAMVHLVAAVSAWLLGTLAHWTK